MLPAAHHLPRHFWSEIRNKVNLELIYDTLSDVLLLVGPLHNQNAESCLVLVVSYVWMHIIDIEHEEIRGVIKTGTCLFETDLHLQVQGGVQHQVGQFVVVKSCSLR